MENNSKEQTKFIPAELSGDKMLSSLSLMANVLGIGVSVTLHVNGGVVSGDIISAKQYFEEIRELLDTSKYHGSNERILATRKNITEIFESMAKVAHEPYQSYLENPEESELPASNFIHLKNARLYVSNLPINQVGVLWRGRMDHVSGFSLALFA
jgi:hypothetical protein